MRCWVEKPASKGGGKCGSTQHLSRDCPFNRNQPASSTTLMGDTEHQHHYEYTNNPGDIWLTEEVFMIEVDFEDDDYVNDQPSAHEDAAAMSPASEPARDEDEAAADGAMGTATDGFRTADFRTHGAAGGSQSSKPATARPAYMPGHRSHDSIRIEASMPGAVTIHRSVKITPSATPCGVGRATPRRNG